MTSEPATPGPADARRLLAEIEATLVGQRGSLNRVEVSRAADFPLERATLLWRALGFPTARDDEDRIFTDADVEALRLVGWLEEVGVVTEEIEASLVRGMGRSFSRMAEWQMAELVRAMTRPERAPDPDQVREVIESLIPVLEDLQNFVWRRHLSHAAARVLLQPGGDGADRGVPMLVGFADIVGFTRRSREMSVEQLDELVETFEAHSADVITEHGGRIIKTIGDEILFVSDDPVEGGRMALTLLEAADSIESFPELHIGLAYGDVLSRVGDVFGPTVNLASRLASVARPGRVLIDRELSRTLKPYDEDFRVRRARTTAVRGYPRLDRWSLRPARTEDPGKQGRHRRRSSSAGKESKAS